MSLSDRYKKASEQIANERQRLAIERAKSSVKRLMESEQFKLSALALPESKMAVDAIIHSTVSSALDSVNEFVDTLRAKGFRPAEIRKVVHDSYVLWHLGPYTEGVTLYEDMLKPVADHVRTHQEIYNTLDPEQLRGE